MRPVAVRWVVTWERGRGVSGSGNTLVSSSARREGGWAWSIASTALSTSAMATSLWERTQHITMPHSELCTLLIPQPYPLH